MLEYYQLPPASGGKPAHAIIILHGLGDSGRGMMSFGAVWRGAMPDAEIICPDAPFAFDGDPSLGGHQWFPLRDFSLQEMTEGVLAATPYLDVFIDHILETRALPAAKVALVGFSQGTMMALYVGPRRSEQLAGIVGYAGLLIGGENLAVEKKSAPPVLLIHGTHDEVVPHGLLMPSENGLRNAGLDVASISRPGLGHSVDEVGLAEGMVFLRKVLASPSA